MKGMFKLQGNDGDIHYAHETAYAYHFPMCCEDIDNFDNANLKLAFDYENVTCKRCLDRLRQIK